MAAVFPLDTTKPWTFNGVTYEYDAADDRWYVISTNKTDFVDDSLETLERGLETTNDLIDKEIENRSNLLDLAASKNNQQDSAIAELDGRVDAISSASGSLSFKGKYKYVLEKSDVACQTVQVNCILAANGDMEAIRNCQLAYDACIAAVDDPYPEGSFTTGGTTNVIRDIEEFVINEKDLNGLTFDWINLVEVDDYLEFFEETEGDTSLYQVIEEPKTFNTSRTIRVKFLKETSLGDGKFNLDALYDLRVFKSGQGLDLSEADERYVAKPYVVYFADSPTDITPVAPNGVLRSGELWFDTRSLQMFVWNNNSWVAVSPPPTQDMTVSALNAEIELLKSKPDITSSATAPTNPKLGDLWFNPSTLKFAFYTEGAWVNPDQS